MDPECFSIIQVGGQSPQRWLEVLLPLLDLKTSKMLSCSSYALFLYFKREKVLSFPFLAKPNRSMVNREFNFTL